MKKLFAIAISILTFTSIYAVKGTLHQPTKLFGYPQVLSRDPLKWPFSSTSIWNTPIGSNAQYVAAKLEAPKEGIVTVDEDLIILTPNEPLLPIYESNAAWDRTKNRCVKTGKFIGAFPIPKSFVVSPKTWDGVVPNAGIAILLPDGKTIAQGQPYAFCPDSGYATLLRITHPSTDIKGDGYYGAHGGSKLSAIGGTLRVDELTPISGPIRHALKINICASVNCYYDQETKGFRWPAVSSDNYAGKKYGTKRTTPVVKDCRLGALMAIPAEVDLKSLKLETKPAKMIAQALQDFGAYVVDDTGWDVFAFETEWGPNGRFTDQFKKSWGYDFVVYKESTPWSRDIAKLYSILHIVVNNGPNSIGGGGEPRAPLAPDFK